MSSRLLRSILVAGALVLAPAAGWAQAAPQDAAPAVRVPVVDVSLGLASGGQNSTLIDLPRVVAGATGVTFDASARTGIAGAVRVAVGRLVIEAQASRMSSRGGGTLTLPELGAVSPPTGFVADSTFNAQESRHVTTAGGAAAVRIGVVHPRLSSFLGSGLTVTRVTRRLDATLTCLPRVAGGCAGRPDLESQDETTTTRPSLQVVYGLDVSMTPRLAAFAMLRWSDVGRAEFGDDSLSLVSGVRLALRTRVTGAERPEVRVTATDGSRRTGRLVALSATDVVVRRGGVDDRVPLSEVRRVETVTRRVRSGALFGGISGSLVGFAIGAARAPSTDMGASGHSLLGGLWGTGVGALLGALMNLTVPPHILHGQLQPAGRPMATQRPESVKVPGSRRQVARPAAPPR